VGAVERLAPGSFAFVMATGIVSVAAAYEGWPVISAVLLWIAAISFAVLVVLNIVRAVRHRRAVLSDLRSPARSFGWFTFVAGTSVVATRLDMAHQTRVALIGLAVAALAWLVLGYAIPALCWSTAGITPLVRSADGSWFVWVVASQSVAVLGASVEPSLTTGRHAVALLSFACWAVGVFLYAATAVAVALRLISFALDPIDLTAPYWVGMGATAITVVAGSTVMGMVGTPILTTTHDFVAGLTVLFWAFGTWLIPPLILAGYWRHVHHRVPLRYETGLWSIVFPLGMYGVGSHALGEREGLPLLTGIGHIEIFVALAAWLATFLAMLWAPWRVQKAPAQPPGR